MSAVYLRVNTVEQAINLRENPALRVFCHLCIKSLIFLTLHERLVYRAGRDIWELIGYEMYLPIP